MRKKLLLILVFLCVFLFVVGISKANVRTDPFVVLVENGGGLGFQHRVNKTVFLTVTSGSLNSSYAYVSMYSGGGYFVFRGNNSVSFNVTANDLPVMTEINNTVVEWGGGISLTSSDLFLLRWSVPIAPFLPLLFIIGMSGFACLFIGMLYPIHLFKQGDWHEGLVMGASLLGIGLAFVLAWLWGG